MTGKLANKVALVTGGVWDRSRLSGSIASIKGFPSVSVCNASKAAVRSFVRHLRRFEERGFSGAGSSHPSVGRGKT